MLIECYLSHDFRSIPEVVRYIWRNEGPRGFVAGKLILHALMRFALLGHVFAGVSMGKD